MIKNQVACRQVHKKFVGSLGNFKTSVCTKIFLEEDDEAIVDAPWL